MNRPFVLSIAGFDNSSGAGITSDIKVFEQLKVYGLSVCTALTVQNDEEITKILWQSRIFIEEQIDILFKLYPINFCKIGIVEDIQMLKSIILRIKKWNAGIKIVFDPVMVSSSGFKINEFSFENIQEILDEIYLITPNYPELMSMNLNKLLKEEFIDVLRKFTNIYLKGGHNDEAVGTDELYTTDNKEILEPISRKVISKHGSGCVFSSAVTAYLAQGEHLSVACSNAKKYTFNFLNSNNLNLGFHT